jgi:lipopolysaccharide transport system ATP-binding protein
MFASPAATRACSEPTVFHITHWKAGSQWVNRILHTLVPDRLFHARQDQFLIWPVQHGKVYPTLYVTREQFYSVALPTNYRRFVILRDLRDTLVSFYFSLKVSHAVQHPVMADLRADIQESWVRAGEPLVRYEHLLDDDLAIFEQVLL